MSIIGVLTRFLLAYIVLFVGAVIGLQLFGVASNSGINVGVLIGAGKLLEKQRAKQAKAGG